MRFILTGATGLLGRNILFEIIKQYLTNLEEVEIVILGRNNNENCLLNRINEILRDDGVDYLNIKYERQKDLFENILSRIKCINFDLTISNLGICHEDQLILSSESFDYCFHVGALTNFWDSQQIIKELFAVNFDGVKNLLNLIKELYIKQFNYISTVYSSGASKNEYEPDFINNTGVFRNPYEKSKLFGELYLKELAKKEKLKYKIFRVSTIAGRLIEKEIGAINKFDVFYQWAAFLLKYKMKLLSNSNDIYEEPVNIDFRLAMHPDSTMNICPADYAAKLIYQAGIILDDEIVYHIVNPNDIPTRDIVKIIMKCLNITGYQYLNSIPLEKNNFEKLYYRSVGKIFSPYILDQPIKYLSDNIQRLLPEKIYSSILMDQNNFKKLIDFAKWIFRLTYPPHFVLKYTGHFGESIQVISA